MWLWRSPAAAGGRRRTAPTPTLTLLLGGRPPAVHAGIFLAVERGFDEAEGVELDRPPRAATPRELLRAGRVQAAVLDASRGAGRRRASWR